MKGKQNSGKGKKREIGTEEFRDNSKNNCCLQYLQDAFVECEEAGADTNHGIKKDLNCEKEPVK